MKLAILYDDAFLDHFAPGYHPECPERLVAFRRALEEAGFWEEAKILPAREATREELARVHRPEYIDRTLERLDRGHGHLDPDTFFSPGSRKAALGAAGGGVDLAREVWAGEADVGLALVRPPGHHAEASRAMGFCIFNNIGVAAAALLADGVERILIFDPDVHHGNATQHQFEESRQVLYVSFHQWPHYPGTGLSEEVGRGDGAGYTANVPFPWSGSDPEYAEAADRILVPLAREFKPQILLASIGFDAHVMDPLAGMDLTSIGYAYLGRVIREIAAEHCGGKTVLFLEGGYEIGPASEAFVRQLRAISGDLAADRPRGEPNPRHLAVIERTLEELAPYRPLGG